MDPDANLIEQRRITEHVMSVWDACADDGTFTAEQQNDLIHSAYRLAELVQALDHWIVTGGFYPRAWTRADDHLTTHKTAFDRKRNRRMPK